MKISSANFLRISLLMPYVLAFLLAWLSGVFDPYDPSAEPAPMVFFATMIEFVSVIYLLGAVYWFIPYTILVLVFLAILITGFTALWPGSFPNADISVITCAFPLSLFFGYVFIGAAAWIYHFLKSRNIIVDEEIIIVDEN